MESPQQNNSFENHNNFYNDTGDYQSPQNYREDQMEEDTGFEQVDTDQNDLRKLEEGIDQT